MVKTFKNLLLQNRGCLGDESLLKSSGTGSTKVAKIMVVQVCFPMHLYGKKTFKNLILQNSGFLVAESLHILLGTVTRGPLVFNPIIIPLTYEVCQRGV